MVSSLRLLLGAFLFSGILSAQPGPDVFLPRSGEKIKPDTIFYPFYNEVQMIEIDHIGAWERDVASHEMSQPRGLSWSMLIPGPVPNELLFRNTDGVIVKAFNTLVTLDSLNNAFAKIPIAKKSTGISLLTHTSHRDKVHSAWFDHLTRQNDFNGYYLVYDDSSLIYPKNNHWFNSIRTWQNVGLIDSFGNIFLPIGYTSLLPANNYILACKDSVWGLLDDQKQEVVPMIYDYAAFDSQEEIIFIRNQKIQLIYDLRRNRFFPIDDAEEITIDQMHSDRYNPQQLKERPALYPFRSKGLTGLMDTNYTVITPAVYQLIQWHVNGRALVCRNNLFGYLDEHGKEIIPCQYTYGEFFRDGIAVVQYEGKFRNIDESGVLLETNKRSHENWRNHSYTSSSNVGPLKVIHTVTGMGLAGKADVFVIPPVYQNIRPLNEYSNGKYVKSSVYFEVKRFDKVGIMDTAGNLMLPIEYEMIGDNPGVYGFRMVKKNEQHWGVINRNFAVIVPCLYEGIGIGYADTYFMFWKNNKCGTIDTNGRVIIPAIYRSIYQRKNGRMLAMKDSLYGFIDTLGNTLIPFRYPSVLGDFSDGLVGFLEQGKWGFMDSTGAVIISPRYNEIRRFQSDITGVRLENKWGFIDRKGKPVVDYQYDYVGQEWFSDSTVEVRRNGWIGFVNEKGEEVIPCIYQNGWGFHPELGHSLERNGKKEYVKAR